MVLRRVKVLPSGVLQGVIAEYRQSGVSETLIAKVENNSPLGRVLASGIRNAKSSREVMKEAIEESGRAGADEL